MIKALLPDSLHQAIGILVLVSIFVASFFVLNGAVLAGGIAIIFEVSEGAAIAEARAAERKALEAAPAPQKGAER